MSEAEYADYWKKRDAEDYAKIAAQIKEEKKWTYIEDCEGELLAKVLK